LAVNSYDPLKAPDPDAWLALDEQERIDLAEDYHRRAKVHLPRLTLHAVVHTIVETQCAMADKTPVRRTIERLRAEGLDRHEAIHAVGMVLAEPVNDLMQEPAANHASDPNEAYLAALEVLTAQAWRDS